MPELLGLVISVSFLTTCAVVFVWFLVDVFRFLRVVIKEVAEFVRILGHAPANALELLHPPE